MAKSPPGDGFAQDTNGAIDAGQQEVPAGPIELRPSMPDGEQTLADADQTMSDSDQSLADADQTSSESDQSSADRDQWASDRDQDASDRDLALGVDPRVHERTRHIRLVTTRERAQTASARVQTADLRDETAHARDLAARARDHSAAARDLMMAARDVGDERFDSARAVSGPEIVVRATGQRQRAAHLRVRAAEHRELAAQDRDAAARDRVRAAGERLEARADREALVCELARSQASLVTGAPTRAADLADLETEIGRCMHTDTPLSVVCIELAGPTALPNTSEAMIDAKLATTAATLGPRGLLVRLGALEFLWAMPNVTLAQVRARFSDIAGVLAPAGDADAIRTGFAQLAPGDRVMQLIARADNDLTNERPRVI